MRLLSGGGFCNLNLIWMICGFFSKVFASSKWDSVIAIDLGYTHISGAIAVMENNVLKPYFLRSHSGSRRAPNYIAFTEKNETLFWEQAKKYALYDAKNSIFALKRIIGTTFLDPNFQEDLKLYPFEVENEDGWPFIRVSTSGDGKKKLMDPKEMVGMYIRKYVEIAETKFPDRKISSALLTVPLHFGPGKRVAIISSIQYAGLTLHSMPLEPISAIKAYSHQLSKEKDCVVCVVDMGGETLDVSFVAWPSATVLANETVRLGGEDFDFTLVKYLVQDVKDRFGGKNVTKKPVILADLKREAEKAKQALSQTLNHTIKIDNIFNKNNYSLTITRDLFETICSGVFEKTMGHLERIWKKVNFNYLVLAGGSMKIPRLQRLIQDQSNAKVLYSISPDQVILDGVFAGEGKREAKVSKSHQEL